jgi:hypothetical protein
MAGRQGQRLRLEPERLPEPRQVRGRQSVDRGPAELSVGRPIKAHPDKVRPHLRLPLRGAGPPGAVKRP